MKPMAKDINSTMKRIIKTGKIEYGTNSTMKRIAESKAKLILIAKNCPEQIKQDLKHHSKIASIPIYDYEGSALELGEACGKPFLIAALTVLDAGDMKLNQIIKETKA